MRRDESELTHRVYQTQSIENSVGDWVRMVEEDKKELEIEMTNSEIQGVSEDVFKSYVKKKVKINHLKYLNTLKKKHYKSNKLECKELKMAEYMTSSRFNLKKKQLLFKLRSRTLDVEQNFKNQKQSPWCLTCGLFPETQGHLLQCPEIVTKLNYLKGIASKLDENDVYSSIAKQEIIVSIYSDIIEERENIINNVIE